MPCWCSIQKRGLMPLSGSRSEAISSSQTESARKKDYSFPAIYQNRTIKFLNARFWGRALGLSCGKKVGDILELVTWRTRIIEEVRVIPSPFH
jgi:hypothetical protein